jgi:hypothetical protein
VAKLSTTCTPLGVCRSFDEFDLVQAVFNPRLKLSGTSEVAVKGKTGVATDN